MPPDWIAALWQSVHTFGWPDFSTPTDRFEAQCCQNYKLHKTMLQQMVSGTPTKIAKKNQPCLSPHPNAILCPDLWVNCDNQVEELHSMLPFDAAISA